MWFWLKKSATRRRRKGKRDLSWEELCANDARRAVLETSKKDVEFRKFFISSLVGTQEPSEPRRRRQDSMAVLDQIMASEESLDRFAEIELLKYRKSGQAGPEQEIAEKKLPETEVGDKAVGVTGEGGEKHGFNLTALLQNPLVNDILGIIAMALLVRAARFIGKRLALAQNQSTTKAVENLYVVLVDGKLSSVTETQYKEWEAQGKLVPAAPASETGTQPEAPPHAP